VLPRAQEPDEEHALRDELRRLLRDGDGRDRQRYGQAQYPEGIAPQVPAAYAAAAAVVNDPVGPARHRPAAAL